MKKKVSKAKFEKARKIITDKQNKKLLLHWPEEYIIDFWSSYYHYSCFCRIDINIDYFKSDLHKLLETKDSDTIEEIIDKFKTTIKKIYRIEYHFSDAGANIKTNKEIINDYRKLIKNKKTLRKFIKRLHHCNTIHNIDTYLIMQWTYKKVVDISKFRKDLVQLLNVNKEEFISQIVDRFNNTIMLITK